MKTNITISLKITVMKTFLIITLLLITQTLFGQTTQEEYNFITKGYRFTIDYGLDMKRGYTMKSIKNYQLSGNASANIQGLFRGSEQLAGYLVTIKDGVFEKDICIPTEQSSTEIWKQYEELLQSLPITTQRKFIVALSKFLSQKPILTTEIPLADTDTVTTIDAEEGTGGIVIPKKTNPLLPSNVKGINHHTIRFFPDPPQTAADVSGNITLNICVNKEGEIVEAKVTKDKSTIKNTDVIDLVIANVRKYKFSLNVYAPDSECGYITYTFTKIENEDD